MTRNKKKFATEYNRVQPSPVVEKSQTYQYFRDFTTLTTEFYINFSEIERIERFEK